MLQLSNTLFIGLFFQVFLKFTFPYLYSIHSYTSLSHLCHNIQKLNKYLFPFYKRRINSLYLDA